MKAIHKTWDYLINTICCGVAPDYIDNSGEYWANAERHEYDNSAVLAQKQIVQKLKKTRLGVWRRTNVTRWWYKAGSNPIDLKRISTDEKSSNTYCWF